MEDLCECDCDSCLKASVLKKGDNGEVLNFISWLCAAVRDDRVQYSKDNEGQLIVYTGMFEWEDGTIHDEAEEQCIQC